MIGHSNFLCRRRPEHSAKHTTPADCTGAAVLTITGPRIRSVRAGNLLCCGDRAVRQAGVPDHEQCVLQRVDGLEPLNSPELAGFPNNLPE